MFLRCCLSVISSFTRANTNMALCVSDLLFVKQSQIRHQRLGKENFFKKSVFPPGKVLLILPEDLFLLWCVRIKRNLKPSGQIWVFLLFPFSWNVWALLVLNNLCAEFDTRRPVGMIRGIANSLEADIQHTKYLQDFAVMGETSRLKSKFWSDTNLHNHLRT